MDNKWDLRLWLLCKCAWGLAGATTAEVFPKVQWRTAAESTEQLGPLPGGPAASGSPPVVDWPSTKRSGNRGKSCPRQNSRRVTMWRQWNRHLSLARPQALPTWPSVHFPTKEKAPRWVTRWLFFFPFSLFFFLCYCATANLKVNFICFHNSCSIAWRTHTSCCTLTAMRVARIFLSEFGPATNPWKLQCNCIHGKSQWPLRPYHSLSMKNIFTKLMERPILELKLNSLSLYIITFVIKPSPKLVCPSRGI